MSRLEFSCGCSFECFDTNKIIFSPKIENINLSCKKTWDLLSEGNTKGVFQLESRLGQSIAKKLKPENIEQLSALISILRPGSLEAIRDGKSVTNHYIDKKNCHESIDYFHPSLEPILNTTLGELIYQEQAIQIAKDIAGFTLSESDGLRKSIGKKDVKLMAEIKGKFLEGCKKENIVDENDAQEIFGWIEKSQRYSFNKSHAVSYAMNAYLSAYAKAHFPQAFFCSYLRFAKDKVDPQQEIKQLIKNANEMDIEVCLPNLRIMNRLFEINDDKIYFGLTDIKGLGLSVYNKIIEINNSNPISKMNYLQLMVYVLMKINSSASKALISAGAIDFYQKNRTEMLFDFELLSSLTSKEISYILPLLIDTKVSLKEVLQYLISHIKVNRNRKTTIQALLHTYISPPYSLIDKIEWLADTEASYLGTAISCSKLDSYNINMVNSSCKEFKNISVADNKKILLAGEITYVNIIKTKTGKTPGKEMAFLSIEDQTGSLDSVIFFPETYEKYKHYLFSENILVFSGLRAKTKDGLVVEKCFVPTS
jgi:DNA polymerase-3 subunit alpha